LVGVQNAHVSILRTTIIHVAWWIENTFAHESATVLAATAIQLSRSGMLMKGTTKQQQAGTQQIKKQGNAEG